jgi:hypothetical protein
MRRKLIFDMKAIRRVIVLGIIIGAASLGRQAQACGIGFQLYLPFFSFGLGLGVPSAFTYAYAQPACAYAYGAPVAYDPPQPMAPAMQPAFEAPPVMWTPSTPGVGHWVSDPQPYRYVASTAAKPRRQAPIVMETKTLGDVPVYVIEAGR